MKTNSIVFLFFVTLAGCDRSGPPSGSGAVTPNTSTPVVPGATPPVVQNPTSPPTQNPTPQDPNSSDGCENTGPCEQQAYVLVKHLPSGTLTNSGPVKLTTAEHASLTAALAASQSADSTAHIHAEVANRRLVFKVDQPSDSASASHLSGNESEISLTAAGPSRKIVATEPALQLLRKRAVH